MKDTNIQKQEAAELNLSGVKCPLNFVKAKLTLEKLAPGSQLKIILDLGEAVETVPKSLLAEGYEILEQKQENNNFILLVVTK
jgi:TusA-related sulfurtransferase